MVPCSTLRLPTVPLSVVHNTPPPTPAPCKKIALPAAWRRLPRPLPARLGPKLRARRRSAGARQVRSALTPTSGRGPRPRCCTQVSHSQCRANIAPPGPRPRGAADSSHSRARAPGAQRPLSCKRQGESGAPATPLAMPPFPNSRCKETKPGWTHQDQCRQEDCLADPAWARGRCKSLQTIQGFK